MPHISSLPLEKKQLQDLNENFDRFLLSMISGKKVRAFRELFTHTERVMIVKRLGILLLIADGVSTYHISKRLHVSPSTVARFEVSVDRGAFDQTLSLLKEKKHARALLQILSELIAVPFELKQRPMHIRKRKLKSRSR